jgi:hypothetical protein
LGRKRKRERRKDRHIKRLKVRGSDRQRYIVRWEKIKDNERVTG